MVCKKAQVVCLAAGATAGSLMVWLCFSESGKRTRESFAESAKQIRDILNHLEATMSIVHKHAEETDRFLTELVRLGREQAAKAEILVNSTVRKFESASDAIEKNVVDSALEVSAFLKDFKHEVGHLVSSKKAAAA